MDGWVASIVLTVLDEYRLVKSSKKYEISKYLSSDEGRKIISIAKEMNLTFREDNIPIKSINEMDEAFISSTGIGLLPCTWNGWKSNFEMTSKLKIDLNQLIKNS